MNGEINILLQELCLLIDVLICFAVPIIGAVLVKHRSGRALKAFLAGMVAFTVSQLILRIPIITIILPGFTWYQLLQLNTIPYGIFLGLTAGVFEETARLVLMKLLLKGRTKLSDGLAFGLGHGGIEAMALVGINSAASMILYPAGYLDLSDQSSAVLLTGGVERIFAMTFHVGASLIVLFGIRQRKALRYTLLAILLHALVDSMVVILPAQLGLSMFGIEVFVAIASVLVLGLGINYYINHNKIKGEN